MDIVLFGATGMIGSRIAAEAAARGHRVTAVSRSGQLPDTAGTAGKTGDQANNKTRANNKASDQDSGNVTAMAADARDQHRVADLVRNADVVGAALVPPRDGSDPRAPFLQMYREFLSGVRDGGGPRTVIVGGAGSLLVAPGKRLVDEPGFPDAYKGEALAHADLLEELHADASWPTWTYISPAPEIGPGRRTGEFRLGVGDDLLPDAGHISAEDYAVAFVDELESGQYQRQRLSVAQTE